MTHFREITALDIVTARSTHLRAISGHVAADAEQGRASSAVAVPSEKQGNRQVILPPCTNLSDERLEIVERRTHAADFCKILVRPQIPKITAANMRRDAWTKARLQGGPDRWCQFRIKKLSDQFSVRTNRTEIVAPNAASC